MSRTQTKVIPPNWVCAGCGKKWRQSKSRYCRTCDPDPRPLRERQTACTRVPEPPTQYAPECGQPPLFREVNGVSYQVVFDGSRS